MNIAFRTRKLEKAFNDETILKRQYGSRRAKAIAMRMAVLKSARNLAGVPTTPPDRRHQLVGDRDERFAVDLVHPYRLVFAPDHAPIPRDDDGGIDIERVTSITVEDVVDYH